MGMPSMPLSGGQLGCFVVRCLVAGTPLEVMARQVALGRECCQIQVMWVLPVETGSHAGRELECMALMLVTAGVTTGGALGTSSSQSVCSSAWKGLLVQSTAVVGDFQEYDGFSCVTGVCHCGVGEVQRSCGAPQFCSNTGGARRSCHFLKRARSASIAANWLEDVGGDAFHIVPTITCRPLRMLSSADTAGI